MAIIGKEKESDIQVAICEYLNIVKNRRRFIFFSPQNENFSAGKTRSQFSGADFGRIKKAKAMGLTSGVADLILLHNGNLYALEVKTQKGRLSENQKRFRDDVLRAGGEYAVVRSVDDVRNALNTWRVE